MKAPSDMPRRRRRRRLSGRGRILLIVAVVALFVLIISLRGIAGFYTDYLWFDALGLASVWGGILGAKVALAVIFTAVFFALMWVNLTVAERLAPKFRPPGPEEDLLQRYHDVVGRRATLLRIGVSLLFALFAGVAVSGQWRQWILFTNRVDFGVEDPEFGVDIGFYVFQLPFLSFVVSWLFTALIIVFIVTAIAHYLNGGIRVQTKLPQRVTPQVKAHLSVLLGVLALVKAADYWLQRYELTFSTRGAVDGATYTDVNAQLPVLNLLILISLLSFVLFIVNIRRRGWVLPVLAVGLWGFVAVVAGGIYPAVIQRFQVEPAESTKEAEFIDRNIEATRAAMGLAGVETIPFAYDEALDAQGLLENEDTIRNIRLLDPGVVNDTYQRLQAERGFYQFPDNLDVDRYVVDDETLQVVLGARELNTSGIPQSSWEGRHLAFTHGYGVAISAANAVTSTGRPDFLVKDIPVVSEVDIPVDQPGLYFGENLGGYSIVHTDREEVDFQNADGETVTTEYEGDGGVSTGSVIRRAAFALRFGDINPLISNFLTSESRIIYIRDVRERVETIAPFLEFDADPYPVVVDGRVVYVIDGYTTTDKYPYGQRADTEQLEGDSGLRKRFNYVRNSVKAVVDSFDGTVTFYVLPDDMLPGDTADPIIQAYRKAFPEMFTDFEDMPEDLQQHVRYPEDLFRVQTNMWASYHIGEAQSFYEQAGGWQVAQDPGTDVTGTQATQTTNEQGEVSGSRERRIDPYYLLMRLPEQPEEEFLILRSFVPVSEADERKELTSFMIGKSDLADYGTLQVFEMPGAQVDGPAIVNSNIQTEVEISEQISLLNQEGSQVRLGNLLLIPIEQSILYVRPLYVQAQGETQVPELKRVIVAFGDEVVMENTLEEALIEIFGQSPETLEDAPTDDTGATDPGDEVPQEDAPEEAPPDEDAPEEIQTVEQLLQRAVEAFAEADQALSDGDLATYQEKVEEAQQAITTALALLMDGTTTTTTTAEAAEA